MPLLEILRATRETVLKMDIETITRMAGKKLADGSATSVELRQFLSEVEADKLAEYATYCLENSFMDSGQVLQDVINEIGRRLGYAVENGRYQGVRNAIGFDGIWSDQRTRLVVEVKTTDAFSINLDTIASYRDKLAEQGKVDKNSPILLVIGRNDTQSLEAQVRGSRHAWSMRIIGIDALIKLMNVNLATSTKEVTDKIHVILEPIEYTRVDGIVDVIFTATEDKEEELEEVELANEQDQAGESERSRRVPQFTPQEILDAKKADLINAFGKKLGQPLVKRKNSLYADQSGQHRAAVLVSKQHDRSRPYYWYAYHQHQRSFLAEAKNGYMIFGMVNSQRGFAIPYADIEKFRDQMNSTVKDGREYRHVHIYGINGKYFMRLRNGVDVDLESYGFTAA